MFSKAVNAFVWTSQRATSSFLKPKRWGFRKAIWSVISWLNQELQTQIITVNGCSSPTFLQFCNLLLFQLPPPFLRLNFASSHASQIKYWTHQFRWLDSRHIQKINIYIYVWLGQDVIWDPFFVWQSTGCFVVVHLFVLFFGKVHQRPNTRSCWFRQAGARILN